jgi:starch-binding outer membrane protein SusE/F
MKTSILSFITISLLLILFSCKKDETKAVLLDNPIPAQFIEPIDGASFVLTKQDSAINIVFKWKPADYGFEAGLSNTVQLGVDGSDFANPISVFKGLFVDSSAINVYKLNSMLKKANDTITTVFQLRIISVLPASQVSTYADTVISTPIKITITPFK